MIESMADILPEVPRDRLHQCEVDITMVGDRCTEIITRIRRNSDLIADLASTIEEGLDRIDGLERRLTALRDLLNNVITVIARHEAIIATKPDAQ
jgi:hypothetical protein